MRYFLSCCVLIVVTCQCSALAADTAGRVSSAVLKRPNIVIRGANLSKVEIWALPTGTGLGDQHLVFGRAVRKGPAGSKETWVLRLPPCGTGEPYLAAEIVAVGFDATGAEVGRKDLPALGAIELYQTLCTK